MHGGVSGGGGGGRDHIKDPLEVGECVFLFETFFRFEIWAQHTYLFHIIHGSHQGPSRGRRMLFSLLKHFFEGTWKRGCRNCSICDTLSRSGQNTSFLKIENNYPAKNLPGIRFSQGVSLLMQNGLESDVVTNTGTIGHKMVSLHIEGQHHTKIGRSPSTVLSVWMMINTKSQW